MIRTATPADIPRMVELGRVMHAESQSHRRLAFSAERLAASLDFAIAQGFAMVAEDSAGRIVGGMAAIAAPHYFSEDLQSCDLALFIEPECRGGIAAARLIRAYGDWAEARGVRQPLMGITTGVNAEITEALCERLGWRRIGVVMEMS